MSPPPPPPAFADGHGSLVANRRALFETLAAADCADDVKASKKARRPVLLEMTESAIAADEKSTVTKTTGDDSDSGVVVGGKDDETTTVTPSYSSDRPVTPPPAQQSTVTSGNRSVTANDNDLGREKRCHVSSALLPGVADPKPFNGDRILLEADERIPPPMKDIRGPLSDDLKRASGYRLGHDTKDPVDPVEDLEIKSLADKLPKTDRYESGKRAPVPSPRKIIKSSAKTDYPESLNPFAGEEDDDSENKRTDTSTNPFGSDLEDEEEPLPAPKANVSLNPFSSDKDENDVSYQPPLPKPRTVVLSPVLKSRRQTYQKQSSAPNLSLYSTTARKKRPAPPPPKSRPSLGNINYSNNNMQTSSPDNVEDSSCSGGEPSSSAISNQESNILHKSRLSKCKRKKRPAPQFPVPQRRQIEPMLMEDIKQGLLDIEIKQQEIQTQGMKFENDIGLKCYEDGTLPCTKPIALVVVDDKNNFSKRLLKNIEKVKSKNENSDDPSPSRSPSNSSYSKGTLKKFMTLGNFSEKFLRPKST